MSALFILQGNRMDPHIGPNFKVPSASISIFNALGVIIGTPIYGWLIIPYAKKLTGHEQGFTELQRIGVGLAISVISMVSAGSLELFRLNIVRKYDFYDTKFVPMSLFWQVPQYFLVGFAEVFAMVGKSEFFYNQAPDAMRSLCSALELSTFALGNYLSSLLVTIVTNVTTRNGSTGWIPENINRGHLDYFFGLLALLSFANFIVFVCIAKCYRYKTVIRHDAT
ncbi:Proton-dependent oligopeptide transporter family [Trema orientale]|uniref:Proton-dependent oligopeptide transporter family n=1 Tax=Trema orientale TaxID=63057 RepID=A0A2P5CRN3_TREOI|nr:Proton-dependent oligopeptide transporter family [Trema orientale]